MRALSPLEYLLGTLSGGALGLSLGLFGGGGSILAVIDPECLLPEPERVR
jgi:hypothetical protein